MRIAALASGVGNVRSVLRALDCAIDKPKEIEASADPDVVRRADVLVVPGQGSFGAFAAALEGGLREALGERIAAGTPYLGICLGLQILFEESDEAPGARGLGVLKGRVERLRAPTLPHMGWNRAEVAKASKIFAPAHYYFAHTFAAAPVDPTVALATTQYEEQAFVSAVAHEAIMGVQFHPEKSQKAGLGLLQRFFAEL
jgi:glutamine amidotransferase